MAAPATGAAGLNAWALGRADLARRREAQMMDFARYHHTTRRSRLITAQSCTISCETTHTPRPWQSGRSS
jgi:hypothetical protein